MSLAWVFLIIAAVCNVTANTLLRSVGHGSGGSAAAIYFSWFFIFAVFSFGLNLLAYTQALKSIPLSVAYPMLVGISTFGIAVISSFLFGEAVGPQRIAGYLLLVMALYFLNE